MRTRFESLSRLLGSDTRTKGLLNLLEADWPTALQVVPAAFKVVESESCAPCCRDLLTEALRSYKSALGRPDQERLVAFMDPFLDGLAEMLEREPAPTAAVVDMQNSLLIEVEKESGASVRARLEAMLLPADTSLGLVWRSIQGAEHG